ncbi:protein CBFA2T1 [Caerostris darwini]|uniref:Protein CBFA2T1 n=1 Tax=Caerostris darwini TaxID=1538125 RepID=A0AAV4M683_9ARAC|nr:protein CBFA2T1 [Caerostris darwini]
MAKQSPQQYLRQHEHVILDTSSHPNSEPFEIFQSSSEPKENGKRRSPSTRNGKLDMDYSETNGDGPPPVKRHHPIPSPTLSSRTSPGAPSGLGLPPGLNLRLPDDSIHTYRDREGRLDRYDRFERDFYRPFYGNMSREYSDDREMEEEWRNIHTMLNCILGMVEKTKRALCILQHRSYAERAELTSWIRHPEMEPKKRPSDIVSHFKIAEDRVTEVRRRAGMEHCFEAVNEVKRHAVAELQKAVSAAESKASELVAAERIKMERMLAEARRQAAEDALAVATHQEESTEIFSSSTTRIVGTVAGRPARHAAGATSPGTAGPSASTRTGNLTTESAARPPPPSPPRHPPALHPGPLLTTVRVLPGHRPWLMSSPSRLM